MASAGGALMTRTLFAPVRPRGSRTGRRIRQELSRQEVSWVAGRQSTQRSPAVGLLPQEKTSMTQSAEIPLLVRAG